MNDKLREQQPLLEDYGIITTPYEIDMESFRNISWAIKVGRDLFDDIPLKLIVSGVGGYVPEMFAIIDVIQQDGNINGILYGAAYSAHATIFAACSRRFITNHAILSVHEASHASWYPYTKDAMKLSHRRLEWADDKAAHIYAAACQNPTNDVHWWKQQLAKATPPELIDFDRDDLVYGLKMAKDISEMEDE